VGPSAAPTASTLTPASERAAAVSLSIFSQVFPLSAMVLPLWSLWRSALCWPPSPLRSPAHTEQAYHLRRGLQTRPRMSRLHGPFRSAVHSLLIVCSWTIMPPLMRLVYHTLDMLGTAPYARPVVRPGIVLWHIDVGGRLREAFQGLFRAALKERDANRVGSTVPARMQEASGRAGITLPFPNSVDRVDKDR
jgi:hypothetical protein